MKRYKFKKENCPRHIFLSWQFYGMNKIGRICINCGSIQSFKQFFSIKKKKEVEHKRIMKKDMKPHIDLWGF